MSRSPADRIRIPADVDRPDEILAGLTARQLTVLAPPLLLAAAVLWTARPYLPVPVLILLVTPLIALGVAAALGRRHGLPLDRYAAAAFTHRRTPAVQTPLPDSPPPLPGWVPAMSAAHPEPVAARPLAARVDPAGAAGVVDLGDAVAVLADADAANITTASADDQAATVIAFGRMLNALSGPVQITVRTVPVDLGGHVAALTAHARRLTPMALADAAADHAAFLAAFGQGRTLRARQILLTVRRPVHPGRGGRDAAASQAIRHLEEAASLLATAGIRVRLLDADAASRLLSAAAHPDLPPPPDGSSLDGTVRAAAGAAR